MKNRNHAKIITGQRPFDEPRDLVTQNSMSVANAKQMNIVWF